jgi:hypothetical protein
MADFGQFRGFGDKLFQGQLPTKLGMTANDFFSGILDFYPSAAAAYSLRKLRNGYTGSAIRVRRSSDNAEQDIGFVVSQLNYVLDTSSLTSFCGSGNGFVTIWYDQSGNSNNAVQSTAANQPQIVNSGNVILDGSKPTLLFDSVNDYFLSTNPVEPLYLCAVNKPNTILPYKGIFSADTSASILNGAMYLSYDDPTRSPIFSRFTTGTIIAAKGSQVSNNVRNLFSATRNNLTATTYINSSQVATGTGTGTIVPLGGTNSGRFTLGAGYYNRNVVDYFTGNLQEFIVYTTNQSSNRTGIEFNINYYYGIY